MTGKEQVTNSLIPQEPIIIFASPQDWFAIKAVAAILDKDQDKANQYLIWINDKKLDHLTHVWKKLLILTEAEQMERRGRKAVRE